MAETIWDILGIPPTSDKRAIKKAYAAKCSACHPEEHPEEFDRLHKAYTAAVKIAARITAGAEAAVPANEQGAAPADGQAAVPADMQTAAPANEQAASPADTQTAAPANEQAAFQPDMQTTVSSNEQTPFQPDTQTAAPASKQATILPSNHPAAPAIPDIPDISQLVEQGMEQELNASCSKLLESLKKLHVSFPKSVDTNGEEFTRALQRLEEWYESPRFKLAGWEPDFLKQLDQWLSANRGGINRAEAVALYRAYRFRQYKSPSYPVIPYMDNIHWEIMQHAYRYEKDMVAMADMPPLPKAVERGASSRRKPWTRSQRILSSLILLFVAVMIKGISMAPSRTSNPSDVQKIINEMKKNPPQTLPAHDSSELVREIDKMLMETKASDMRPSINILSDSGETSPNMPQPSSPQKWIYDGFGPITRPENLPVSPEEYEFYGKNTLTTLYKGTSASIHIFPPASPLTAVMTGMVDIHVDSSYFDQEDETDGVYFYNMKSLGEAEIPFPVWVVPVQSSSDDATRYTVGGCGYWAEALLYAASGQGISGRTWYDQDYASHLVLKWDSIDTLPELAERLLKTCDSFYGYVGGHSPDMDLTIIIGPDADTAVRQLQAVTAPLEEGLTSVTITEEEQLTRCGAGPVPMTGDGGISHDLSLYDSSARWVVRMHMEKDGTNEGFHPGLTSQEALDQIFNHINGLDWVLSRYEIKDT